jgi:hypothetical protein
MQFTTKRIEAGRTVVREQEQRVVLQRRKVQQALADRHPADEIQAQLLIMEQSLLSMVRFLTIIERDAADEISLHKYQTQKRISAQRSLPTPPEVVEKLADDFATQATKSVLSRDDDLNYLDGLAKAMRPSAH